MSRGGVIQTLKFPLNNSEDMSSVSSVVSELSSLMLTFPPTVHIHANQVDWRL